MKILMGLFALFASAQFLYGSELLIFSTSPHTVVGRNVCCDPVYSPVLEVAPSAGWGLTWPAAWISRSSGASSQDELHEFVWTFEVPTTFHVDTAFLELFASVPAFAELNGVPVTDPFVPLEWTCDQNIPGVPGCQYPMFVDVTSIVTPGTNKLVVNVLALAGYRSAVAGNAYLFGDFTGSEVPEPACIALTGIGLVAISFVRQGGRQMRTRNDQPGYLSRHSGEQKYRVSPLTIFRTELSAGM